MPWKTSVNEPTKASGCAAEMAFLAVSGRAGDNVKTSVKLIAPVAMEEGLRFAVREDGRTVGAGVVSKIVA